MPFTPQIFRYDSLPSTNTEAAEQAQHGAAEGVTIVSGEQTAGRGRLERRWVSPAGAGLYASVILRPRFSPAYWSLIPLMAALAVHHAVIETCGLVVDIKWPNDILAGERKLCGILAETVETAIGRAVIVGIGINLTSQSQPDELRDVATSVAEETNRTISANELLESLLRALGIRYAQLETDEGRRELLQDWMAHSTYAQDKHVFVKSDDEQFSGVTRGLENDGALRVETETGEIRIVHAGDVTRVRG
jgi:BirA family transcriptional regulator, biotin operon repressor / biotin---[acetyl-CoA-carboxylase] ligase